MQQHIRNGDALLEKVAGSENPSDCLTKFLSGPDLRGHLARMNLQFEDGRPESAPHLTTSVRSECARDKAILQKARREALKKMTRFLQSQHPHHLFSPVASAALCSLDSQRNAEFVRQQCRALCPGLTPQLAPHDMRNSTLPRGLALPGGRGKYLRAVAGACGPIAVSMTHSATAWAPTCRG